MKKIFILSIQFILVSSMLIAQPLVFDNSFGVSGVHKAVIPGNQNGFIDMQILSDQKMICLGSKGVTDSTDQVFLAKYNANGTLDASYGTNGVSAYFGNSNASYAQSIFDIQQDGKVVLGVEEFINGSNNSVAKIIRYNANGTIDNTFGNSGVATLNFTSDNNFVEKVDVHTDGKILASVQCIFDSSYIVRLQSNGSIDNSFGVNGYVKIPSANVGKYFGPLKVLSDGSILVSGYRGYSVGGQQFNELYVYKYNSSGVLDNTFGTSGVFIYNDNNNGIYPTNIEVQSDNKIIVGGYKEASLSNAFLIRINVNGTIDNAFGNNGVALYSESNFDCSLTRRFKVTGDNKITCLISKYNSNGDESLSITRFNANGTPDNTLNNGSSFYSIASLPYVVSEDFGAVDVQADGKIVFATTETDAGYINLNSVIGRLIPSTLSSTNEMEWTDKVSINPNPANNSLYIKNDLGKDFNCAIIDINGKVVATEHIDQAKVISTKGLANGMYLIHIFIDNQQFSTKLLIQH